MNTNVGDMPLEIFSDYVSDYLDVDFPWEYLVVVSNGAGYEDGAGDIPASHFRFKNSLKGNGRGYGRDIGYGSGTNTQCCFGYGNMTLRHDFSEVDRGCGGNNNFYTGCG
jgi:hypothetical protein